MPASDAAVPSGCWNNYFCYRNTFYWDKRAMAAGGDWTLARIYHYMHGPSGYTSTLKESIKPPLENRIFYGYGTSDGSYYVEGTNTSNPTNTSRMLDDGTQQWNRARYNAWGKPLAVTDPSGRVTSYTYSTDGIDLLAVRNITGSANDLLASYTYNAQHKPLTVTDAAGQTTILTYNAGGQILTLTNPKNETTLFTYIPAKGGYLTSLTGAMAGATTSFAYDAFGRVRTVTSPDGTAITTDYDNLDRPVMVTYGDGTTEAMIYSRLDLVGRKDRLGRWTSMSYTPLRLLSEVQDPAGRKTTFDWCNCGSLEQLTDPLGHITNWWRDLEGHVIGKQLNNNAITSYGYDSSGRLIERIDARGQLTAYRYYPDNNLMQVSYPNAQIPTPSVGYTYDSRYNRLTAMVDGFGATTYAYYPIGTTPPLGAGRLSSVTGPLANSTISYSYDPLGRVQDRSINGSHGTRTFDALGRIAQVSIPIGAFQYTFLGPTGHLDNILYPSNQKTIFSYFDTTQDFRLQGILNQKSDSSVISAFSYAYNPDGTLSSWSQQADAQIPKTYALSYDSANQLVGAVLSQSGPTESLIHQYVYGYDLAGNRSSEQIDGNATNADYNDTNQLTSKRESEVSAVAVVGASVASTHTTAK
jgi:YD repeat-containing protein